LQAGSSTAETKQSGVFSHPILLELPIQRLLQVWDSDSRRLQLQPMVAPLAGGAYLGVEGRY